MTLPLVMAFVIANPFLWYSPLLGVHAENAPSHAVLTTSSAGRSDSASKPGGWGTIESKSFTIEYDDAIDLDDIENSINEREFYINNLTAGERPSDVKGRIARRLDAIFFRAKEILNMWPSKLRLKVRIYKNRRELNDEYYEIFKKRENYKSFYIHRHKTIYTCASDISDSVLAHEMGHAIVDHYFSTIPPANVGELMASYVDMHLDED